MKRIKFSDYTANNWINVTDNQSKPIDISVKFPFDGRIFECSMSASPTLDDYQKNTWECWIPVSDDYPVDTITFNRKGYNFWGQKV